MHANEAAQTQLEDAKSVIRAGTEVKQFLAFLAKKGEFINGDAVGAVKDALASISAGKQAELPAFRLSGKKFDWHCAPGPADTVALVLRDPGKEQELASALAAKKSLLQQLIDVVPSPIYVKNLDGVITRCNPAFAAFLGKELGDVTGAKFDDIAPESLAKTVGTHEAPLLKKDGQVHDEIAFELGDKYHVAVLTASSLKAPSGAIAGVIGSVVDVSSLKKAEAEVAQATKRLTTVLASAPVGVAISSRESGVFRFFNKAFDSLLNIGDAKDPADSILLSERYRKQSLQDMDMLGQLQNVELRLRRPGMSEARWLKTSLEPVTFEGENAVLWWTSDITRQKHAARELQNKANNDELTGLANSARFTQKLDQCEVVLRGTDTPASLFVLDLDGFKKLNDTKGHAAGDWVLTETAKRLKRAARRADEIARVAGDEFTLLFINKGKEAEMTEMANNILAEINKPFIWNDEDCNISATIGFSVFNGGLSDMNEQLRRADKAMRKAKSDGPGKCCLYQRELEPEIYQDDGE